jgi:hypothetical protein
MIRAATAVPRHRPGFSGCQARTSSPMAARTAAGNRHDPRRTRPAPPPLFLCFPNTHLLALRPHRRRRSRMTHTTRPRFSPSVTVQSTPAARVPS